MFHAQKAILMNIRLAVSRVSAYFSLVVFAMQITLVIASWIVAAVCPGLPVRPILGSEGLRWLFGTFVSNVSTAVPVWLLLVGMAVGTLCRSRLVEAVWGYRHTNGYERMALLIVAWEVAGVATVVALLAFVPHAVLLSAIGTLLPSSFSASIVPIAAMSVWAVSLTYGCIVGVFRSVENIFESMCSGVGLVTPLLIAYIVAAEFYKSLVWTLLL